MSLLVAALEQKMETWCHLFTKHSVTDTSFWGSLVGFAPSEHHVLGSWARAPL